MENLIADLSRTEKIRYLGPLLLVAAELMGGLVLLPGKPSNIIGLYLIASVFSAFVFYLTCLFVEKEGKGFRSVVQTVGLAILVGAVLEGGTLFGALLASPLHFSDWNLKRLIIFVCASYAVIVFARVYCVDEEGKLRPLIILSEPLRAIREIRQSASAIAAVIAILAVDVLGYLYLTVVLGLSFVVCLAFCIAVFVVAAAAVSVHFHGVDALPISVFSASFSLGLVFIVAFPATNLYSWDDQIHYQHALELSYFADVEESPSDFVLSNLFAVVPEISGDASFGKFPIEQDNKWSYADTLSYSSELDSAYSSTNAWIVPGVNADAASYAALGYIPSAVGLWIGRFLHLPFTWIVLLGKVFNLLFYSVVSALAVWAIPTKKILMSVLALIPTAIFMGANYSYDPWIISLMMLYCSCVVRALLAEDGSLSGKECVLLLILPLLAIGPKAVYFPLIGLLLVIPKHKFKSNRVCKAFRLLVVSVGAVTVLTFLLPFIVSNGGGSGDARGGMGVNSTEQTHWILANPLAYAAVLVKFIFCHYLTVGSVESGMTNYAYLGDSSAFFPCFVGVTILLILIVGALDSDNRSVQLVRGGRVLWTVLLLVLAITLICTALYITFTTVASGSIAGVQSRYLLPLVPVLCLFVFNFKTTYGGSVRVLASVSMGLIGAIGLCTEFLMLVLRVYS